MRTLRVPAVLAAAFWAAQGAAHACQACYGQADSPLIHGARMGIWLLLGVTVAVQGGFVAFFICLWRRSRRPSTAALEAEWNDLQRSSSHP